MKRIYLIIGATFLALLLSIIHSGSSAIENFRFNQNLKDFGKERDAVTLAIKQYNINSADFYNTGGDKGGLDDIPAAPLLKRRLFKDINMLKEDGLVMVFDRDRDEIKRIYFPERNIAVAESVEVWAMALQEVKSRDLVYSIKAVEIKVRYILKWELSPQRGQGWVVHHVDVYPIKEDIPEFEMKGLL